jgi:hypothetical protein
MVVPNPVQPLLSPIHYSIVRLRPNKLEPSFNGTLLSAHAPDASLRPRDGNGLPSGEVWNIHVSDKVLPPQTRRTVSRGHGKT